MPEKKRRNPTSVRLTEEDKNLQKKLAEHLGVSENDVLKLGLRALARQEKIIK